MDYTLPNGHVIRGIPEGMSEEDILRYAVHNNLYKPGNEGPVAASPLDEAMEFGGQLASDMGEVAVDMAPAIGGLAGGLAGAKLGFATGAVAGPLGALMGSAIGAFAGAGAGESLRQWIEGEPANVSKAIQEAVIEGSIDTVGGRLFDLFKAAKDISLDKLGYKGRDQGTTQILRDLQEKLEIGYGTTLRGSQIDPAAKIINGLESAAEQALTTRDELRIIAEAQNRYLDDQVEGFVAVSDKLEGESLGILIQNLVENTRTASSEAFSAAFKELDDVGRTVKVSLQGPRKRAYDWRKTKMDGLTKRMQEAIDKGAKIPFTSAQIQKSIDDLLSLSPNTNFSVAFDKLKDLKNRLSAMKGDPATANDPAVAELTGIVKRFEESMLRSARKTSPETAKMYENLMKEYEDTQRILFSDVAVRILREGNPESVGKMLHETGKITPFKEVQKIIAEAKRLNVETGGDVLEGIRQGFLAKHLSAKEGQAINTLSNMKTKLADPDFARTFNELIPKEQKKRMYRIMEEAEILSRGVGGEFSLAVRSAQLAGVQGVASGGGAGLLGNIFKVVSFGYLPKIVASPQRAERMLRMLRTANKYVNNPQDMPPEIYRALSLMLAKFAAESGMQFEEQQTRQEIQPLLENIQRAQQMR